MNTKKTTMLAMLTAAAMALSYLEAQLPSFGIPGVKMGLANIAVIFTLYRFGVKEAVLISLIRVVLVTLLFASPAALAYSLAGAALSLLVMTLLKKTGRFSSVGVSVSGGVAHNTGQILVAMAVLENRNLLYYLPILVISGLAGGVLTGLAGAVLVQRVPENR